jgi:hypothetical protein
MLKGAMSETHTYSDEERLGQLEEVDDLVREVVEIARARGPRGNDPEFKIEKELDELCEMIRAKVAYLAGITDPA